MAGRGEDPRQLLARAASLLRQGGAAAAGLLLQDVVARDPRNAEALQLLGVACGMQGDLAASIGHLSQAVRLKPKDVSLRYNLGKALLEAERFEEAAACLREAARQAPREPDIQVNLGAALRGAGRLAEAAASFEKAAQAAPDHFEAHYNHGYLLAELGDFAGAEEALRRSIKLRPGSIDALIHLGAACTGLNRREDALRCWDDAIARKPATARQFRQLGYYLLQANQPRSALECFQRASALEPDTASSRLGLVYAQRRLCDWAGLREAEPAVITALEAQEVAVPPFGLTILGDDAGLLFRAARRYSATCDQGVARPAELSRRERRQPRLRVAYVSADLRRHAVAHCIMGLVERHDRGRFEVIGVSFGPDDGSEERRRLEKGFDRFLDVGHVSPRALAESLRRLEVDIAVDLMGHTALSRPQIFVHRAAPIQAAYLGYPGTMGGCGIDYIIADRHVLPEAHEPFFSERPVLMPHSYQVNDDRRPIADETPSRREMGLPDDAFVFCCFNGNQKIGPAMFDVWMRILKAVQDSVLWLVADSDVAAENLRREAEARGIGAGRLVFAERAMPALHRARNRRADLFLDTLPYNAHGTASDALWAGLPVLTCLGASFAGRVGASLLHAVGLPELIAASLADYEALAVALARDPGRLGALRSRLASNRSSCPLFDTDRFRRDLEAAYLEMWRLHERGEAPRRIEVAALAR